MDQHTHFQRKHNEIHQGAFKLSEKNIEGNKKPKKWSNMK